MAFMLYSIDEAIDCKYVVTKTMSGQAKAGTLIHIMDANENSDGVAVAYRVTKTGQNFLIKFDSVKSFCKWASPNAFLARHYDSFTSKEINQYMKISNRSPLSALPIIAVALVVIWILALAVIGGGAGAIVGAVLSVVAVVAILFISRAQREKVLMKLYGKVNAGLSFK